VGEEERDVSEVKKLLIGRRCWWKAGSDELVGRRGEEKRGWACERTRRCGRFEETADRGRRRTRRRRRVELVEEKERRS